MERGGVKYSELVPIIPGVVEFRGILKLLLAIKNVATEETSESVKPSQMFSYGAVVVEFVGVQEAQSGMSRGVRIASAKITEADMETWSK
jgi:hypothetical protein